MSDAMWDMEYDTADTIFDEAVELAKSIGYVIPCQVIFDYNWAPRVRKAKKILDDVKDKVKDYKN
jgi:hypothetical protein